MIAPDMVLEEWFGPLDDAGCPHPSKSAHWWKKDPAFDAHLDRTYGQDVALALTGSLSEWCTAPDGRIALILLLDQFTRNIYRNTAQMFTGDDRALLLAHEGLAAAEDDGHPAFYSCFMYMPLMHSEDLAEQESCVSKFEGLALRAPQAARGMLESNLNYAKAHRDIIARFGRFPHRNAILGRPSTAEEAEFLKQPGSSF
jgi:uncharacterized protein (DUF924 family)